MKQSETSNFPAILAFSVHEMKNSLSTVSELIRNFNSQEKFNACTELGQLEFEANRVNNILMQLLILYKIDEVNFTPNIDECFAHDILREVAAQQAPLFAMKNLALNIDSPDNLICYCDQSLICNALSTMVNNVQRYASKQVLLSAKYQDGYVCFQVEDDGKGYPEHFLQSEKFDSSRINLNTGSTGLGLYFATTLAKMHTNRGNTGFVTLKNHSPLGGAVFSIYLP